MNSLIRTTSKQKISLMSISAQSIGRAGYRKSYRPTMLVIKNRQRNIEFKNQTVPKKEVHRSTFLEWNYDCEIYSFGKRLKEDFNEDLLRQALTAKSYVNKLEDEQKAVGIVEPKVEVKHNYDMASKGEDLIRRFTLQYLRHVFPRFPEEGILSLTDYLLSDDVMSNVSFHIGTTELILSIDFPVEKSTSAAVLKALVYALAESSGMNRATLFIRDFIITQLAEQNINELWPIDDPIKMLSDICENEGYKEKPEPRIIGEAGVNTILACYRIGLYLNKQMIGLGFGETIDTAHEMAARDTLRRLFKTTESDCNIPFDLELKPELENQVPNVSINNWSEDIVTKHLNERKIAYKE